VVHYVTVELSGLSKERRRDVLGWWDRKAQYLPRRQQADTVPRFAIHLCGELRATEG
jgi:hypothetical protein